MKLGVYHKPPCFLAVGCLLLCVSVQAQPTTLAIRGATVVDVTDGSLRSAQTVLVEGNRIAVVGPVDKVKVPDDAEVVQAAGGYLIPGLWDMHVHSAASVTWHFPLFLAQGVTGVRNMHSTVDSALALTNTIKRQLAEGELLGPRFLANGPIIDGEPSVWPGSVVVRTAEEARAAVDSLTDGGADFIKVYSRLTRDAYFAIVDQAKQRRIPVVGHVPYRVRPEEAAEAGQLTDEHMLGLQMGCSTRADSVRSQTEQQELSESSFIEGIISESKLERVLYDTRDPSLCAAMLKVYRKNGMAVVPNLVLPHNNNYPDEVISDTVSMKFIPKSMHAQWSAMAGPGPGDMIRSLMQPTREARNDNVRLLNDAGVMLLAGTDVGNPMLVPGISLHKELMLLVDAGLTPLEALQTATLNPARFLGAEDSLGTVEAGKFADLVLLDANPLEDIRNTQRILAVVSNGRLIRRSQLNRLLAEVKALHLQAHQQK